MNNRHQQTARVQAPAPTEASSLTHLNVFTVRRLTKTGAEWLSLGLIMLEIAAAATARLMQ